MPTVYHTRSRHSQGSIKQCVTVRDTGPLLKGVKEKLEDDVGPEDETKKKRSHGDTGLNGHGFSTFSGTYLGPQNLK